MNYQNFNQSVGFPFETNTLDLMQKSWSIFNALGAIVGNFSIISGCELIGSTVSNGTVYINGEVIEFRGGVLQPNVIIVQTAQSMEFEDTNSHEVIYTRYATFGAATIMYPWADFKRGFETKLIPEALALKEDKTTVAGLLARIELLEAKSGVPIGLIAIWDRPSNEIPAGWVEYQALRGKSPIGLDPNDTELDALGTPIGSKMKTLAQDELPNPHGVNIYGMKSDGNQTLILGDSNGNQPNLESQFLIFPAQANKPFSIMDPKRVVHFIQYMGG